MTFKVICRIVCHSKLILCGLHRIWCSTCNVYQNIPSQYSRTCMNVKVSFLTAPYRLSSCIKDVLNIPNIVFEFVIKIIRYPICCSSVFSKAGQPVNILGKVVRYCSCMYLYCSGVIIAEKHPYILFVR